MRGVGGGSRAGVGNTFGGDLAGLARGEMRRGNQRKSKSEDQMTSWAPNVSGPGGP